MAGPRIGWKPGDDDIRLKLPDYPHRIGEYAFPIPNAEGFFSCFRETEVDCRRKELFTAVDPARSKQFVGADEAQFFGLFCADEVLAPVAPCEGKIART